MSFYLFFLTILHAFPLHITLKLLHSPKNYEVDQTVYRLKGEAQFLCMCCSLGTFKALVF